MARVILLRKLHYSCLWLDYLEGSGLHRTIQIIRHCAVGRFIGFDETGVGFVRATDCVNDFMTSFPRVHCRVIQLAGQLEHLSCRSCSVVTRRISRTGSQALMELRRGAYFRLAI